MCLYNITFTKYVCLSVCLCACWCFCLCWWWWLARREMLEQRDLREGNTERNRWTQVGLGMAATAAANCDSAGWTWSKLSLVATVWGTIQRTVGCNRKLSCRRESGFQGHDIIQRRITQKRYKIELYLQCRTNRKSYMVYQTAPFSIYIYIYIYIYIFIHHQDGSTVDIRRWNKIYNLTKKQRMKQSSPNTHAMR